MDLNIIREEINKIDKELVLLLEKRFDVVMKVGEYKKQNNLPILDENREKIVIENCINNLNNKDYSSQIEEIYKHIMSLSRQLQI